MHGACHTAGFRCIHGKSWRNRIQQVMRSPCARSAIWREWQHRHWEESKTWNEGNAWINKVSSMRPGLVKIIEKVHISRYFESPETVRGFLLIEVMVLVDCQKDIFYRVHSCKIHNTDPSQYKLASQVILSRVSWEPRVDLIASLIASGFSESSQTNKVELIWWCNNLGQSISLQGV